MDAPDRLVPPNSDQELARKSHAHAALAEPPALAEPHCSALQWDSTFQFQKGVLEPQAWTPGFKHSFLKFFSGILNLEPGTGFNKTVF